MVHGSPVHFYPAKWTANLEFSLSCRIRWVTGKQQTLVLADTVPHAVIHANHELTRQIVGKFFLL